MKSYKTPLALALAAALTACASPSYTAKTYQTGQVQQAMKVKSATIVSVKEVEIQKKTGNAGAGVGAATGGVSGAMVGSSTNSVGNGLVGMVAGAVIGGVAGAIADNVGKTANAYEILYQVDGTQDVLALVQEKDDHRFKAGDRIRLIEGQFTVRAQPL
mgnify:CR=1 FL=1